jgi:large subunit ribosomal protein L4
MELKLIDEKGQPTASVAVSDAAFARRYNEALVHQVITAYLANARRGTRAQKARGDVNKSHRKPWRQKGTGRARAGFTGSPLWRGGGKVFPSSPEENFSQKVNRKMYRAGVSAILSQLAREDRLAVVERFAVAEPRTRVLARKLKEMGLEDVLVVTESPDENLLRAARNLPGVEIVTPAAADPVSLLRHEKVLITRAALSTMEELLA